MAERDRFELDLAAALRAYLEDAPTEVRPTELARQFATAYPHRRATLGRWGFGPTPAMAWILLAGLLAALLGGALLVGSQQRRLPAVVPPVGQVFECPPRSDPDKPGPVDQARPPHYGEMGFDRRAGRLVALADAGASFETWTFDVCTNTWTQMHPNRVPSISEWPQLVYDVDSDTTVFASYREVWAYDLQTDTWTEKRVAPTDALFIAYDPVSGLVIAADHSDRKLIWTYDVEADTWTPISQARGPDSAVIAYDASVDRLVVYGHGAGGRPPYETWLFDIRTGTWSRSAAVTPAVWGWDVPPAIVYDEAAERTLVGGVAAYDATADRWDILPESPFSAPRVYDAVNRRLVDWGMGGNDLPEGRVAALDLETREWIVLLEASPAQPAPNP